MLYELLWMALLSRSVLHLACGNYKCTARPEKHPHSQHWTFASWARFGVNSSNPHFSITVLQHQMSKTVSKYLTHMCTHKQRCKTWNMRLLHVHVRGSKSSIVTDWNHWQHLVKYHCFCKAIGRCHGHKARSAIGFKNVCSLWPTQHLLHNLE